MGGLGLYLHIPWCVSRCTYCDSNSYASNKPTLKEDYHNALLQEINQTGVALTRPAVDTVFIGGGTPTTVPPEWLNELVAQMKTSFALHPEAEITVEANPGTLSTEYLRRIRCGGDINRLSLGVQSFDDNELRSLGRLHNANTARQAVKQARTAGFDNISLDLILNLPAQTMTRWRHNLREAIKLNPEHLSIYPLIVEPGTVLYRQVKNGEITPPNDDVAADMFAETGLMLEAAGYIQYEISNWARADEGKNEKEWQTPRLASAHNLIYWRNQPYLGLGAGAYSTINGARWMNCKQPQTYIERINQGGTACDKKSCEQIDQKTAITELMMLGLRLTREGINSSQFEAHFGLSLLEDYGNAVRFGLERGLTEWVETDNSPHLRLTKRGYFLANQVIMQFV